MFARAPWDGGRTDRSVCLPVGRPAGILMQSECLPEGGFVLVASFVRARRNADATGWQAPASSVRCSAVYASFYFFCLFLSALGRLSFERTTPKVNEWRI